MNSFDMYSFLLHSCRSAKRLGMPSRLRTAAWGINLGVELIYEKD